jgi:Tol biopolymer transport system component
VVPDPQATTTATRYQVADARRFNGGEGIAVAGEQVLLCTKGDGRTWRYNIGTGLLDVVYDPKTTPGARHLATGDNIVATTTSAFVAEDGGNMEIVGLNLKTGATNPVVRYDCAGSEMTGPAFSPDRRHLLFSSQRKPGVTFMVTGPWHEA